MYRHEQVGIGIIGDLAPHEKVYKGIVFSGIHHFDIGLLFKPAPHFQDNIQGYILFHIAVTEVTGVVPAMTGIQDNGERGGSRHRPLTSPGGHKEP